jgi:hypothetical protein
MTTTYKSIATLCIAAALVGAGVWYAAHHAPAAQESSATQTVTEVIPVTSDGTVLAAMRAHASSTQFIFAGKEYPTLGFFVESIDGRRNADGYYWTLYINGTSSDLGASSAHVKPGDKVEWRYESASE